MNNIRLHKADNVVVATSALEPNIALDGLSIKTREAIGSGHKIACKFIGRGETVRKYNQVIGQATQDINAGELVHEHNLEFTAVQLDYHFSNNVTSSGSATASKHFNGYVRDSDVPLSSPYATRNYIGIVTTVNCSASVARAIAARMDAEARNNFANVDGVVALTHSGGCAIDGRGEALKLLQRTLAGMIKHPNFSHILLLGLGCETNQSSRLLNEFELQRGKRIEVLGVQDSGGTAATIDKGCDIIRQWLPLANQCQREEIPLSALTIGLQCGGSDGLSGVTANPALGVAADLIVKHGGTVILSETPEIYGAEHLLTARAASREVGEKLLERVRWWERYADRQGVSLDNNPSPGNRAGGLTTILEKSLGAVAKAGSSPLRAVYEYAESITESGFVYMDSPGYDPVSATGQIAAGANMVCFTTGRGSVFGSKPAPCLKLATNSSLWQRLGDDMDINCGDIITGECSLEEKGQQIFELIIATASGQQSKSELLSMGDNEFVPWSLGPVL